MQSGGVNVVSASSTRLPVLLGWINIGLGVALFLGYWAYLPMPQTFTSAARSDPGLILYALATAGSAFVAWGMMLRGVDSAGISRATLFRATATGFALLGLMRLGTALFPHAPFDQMIALPMGEFVVFTLLALRLFKAS